MTVSLNKFERFLGIDPKATKSELMRARAVYMMGLAFIATQIINLISMFYSYGEYTFDHTISLIACGLVAITVSFIFAPHEALPTLCFNLLCSHYWGDNVISFESEYGY